MKLSAALVLLGALFVHAGPQGRIAGGDDAILGQLPYQGALAFRGSYFCGAVILAERFALTALTCVCSGGSNSPWDPEFFAVGAGFLHLNNDGQYIRVAEITVNPDFDQLSNGLALLRMVAPFKFNDFVSAIPMATENPPLNAQVEISGWGRTKEGDQKMHNDLQVGVAVVMAERECLKSLDAVENNESLCLGHQMLQGICNGDIGGPAVYQGTLVGVGVEMLGKCGSMLPERFISISAQREWLQNQIE